MVGPGRRSKINHHFLFFSKSHYTGSHYTGSVVTAWEWFSPYTSGNINMKPENTPLEEEIIFQSIIFRGVVEWSMIAPLKKKGSCSQSLFCCQILPSFSVAAFQGVGWTTCLKTLSQSGNLPQWNSKISKTGNHSCNRLCQIFVMFCKN